MRENRHKWAKRLGAVRDRVREFAYRGPQRALRTKNVLTGRRPRFGLALGGGFARGIAHLGVLKVLSERGIPIDYIAGTSVGALIGAAYAFGTPLREMEALASETRFEDFGKWTLSWLGLASNTRIEKFLRRFCAVTRFEELKTPLSIAATDLSTGKPVYFEKGLLGPALRASCAYPGLFLPVEHEGRILVDGFLTAPVPVQAVKHMGADYVIAVFLESGSLDEKPKHLMEIVGRSFSIMQEQARHEWRAKSDLIVEPHVRQFAWDDFDRTVELIAAGEKAMRRAVSQVETALETGIPRAMAMEPAV